MRSGSPMACIAQASRASSATVPARVPQASAGTPHEECQSETKTMMTRFQTMLTTAGMTKRSWAKRTPVITPARERTRIVGPTMRR